jgi:sugar lactone lactonase YvrE
VEYVICQKRDPLASILQLNHIEICGEGFCAMKLFGFRILSFLFFALSSLTGLAQSSMITTHAGPSLPINGSRALTQTIGVPQAVSADGAGGFYISSNHNRIYRVTSDGTLTVIAGTGLVGFSGDNGPATSARFNYIQGIAADSAGNVFIADQKNVRIRKITPAGVITTVAGSGGWGLGGDGGPAVSAHLANPRGLAVDQAGNLFIADSDNHEVRMVTQAGVISTVAGNGTAGFSGDGGPATIAQLNEPVAVAVDAAGNIFIADQHNNRIRMVNSAGVITTITGSTVGFSGDGGPAGSARISNPGGVTVDRAGNLFIADTGNNRIRMVDAGGIITTVAGSTAGFSGDGGLATSAQLVLPVDVNVDGSGNLFIADQGNYRIRQMNPAGVISSVAGTTDDGRSAASAQFFFPNTVAADGAGNVFVADTDIHRIRKITPSGIITTVAGNGSFGLSGDGGPATSAQLYYPAGVAVDGADNLFIADTRNERVRKVTPGGIITTVAGGGTGGDGGPASQAKILEPAGVAVDGAGNLFIAETGANRIRQVNTAGIISTVAGNGTTGFSGDGGPAPSAQLAFPAGIAVDGAGNLFIADSANNRIRLVTPNGIINTVAGNETGGFSGDGGIATAAQIAYPQAVAVDGAGNLFIADTNNQRIRKVTPDGVITTVAGTGIYGFAGDGGPASSAQITSTYGITVGGSNTLFISDTFNNRIRRIVFPVVPFAITDRGGTSLATTGDSRSIQTGYGRIQPSAGSVTPSGLAIFSYRPGNYLISEAGVPATPTLGSGRIYAEINGPVDTGLAIANPNNQTATINFFFTDAAGKDLGSGSTTIGANQQIARFLDSDPFKTFTGTTFQGTFSFTSDVPVGVVAIRALLNERNDFLMSTLPVIDTSAAPASGTVTVPHFSDGGGWTTQILLVNPGNTALTGNVEFHDDNGALTSVAIGGQTNQTFSYAVPPGSSQKLATDGAGATSTSGSVRIIPTDGGAAPVPLVVFSYKPGRTITVTQAGVPSTSGTAFRIYVESAGADGQPGTIQSGVAIANNTSMPASVTLELTNLDGSSTGLPGTASQTLPGFGHIGLFLNQAFPGLPSPFKGILRVSTSSPGISVIGLRSRYNERGDFLITTTPPASETAPSSSAEFVLPHLPDGGGYTTQVILFSGSAGQSPSGSLRLFQQSGQPFAVTLR